MNKRFLLLASALLFCATLLSLSSSLPTHAAPVVGFQAGKIIDDAVFTSRNSMDVNQIQSFLNSKVPNCDTNGTQPASDYGRSDITRAQYAALRGWQKPPYTCLRNYTEGGRAAAQIIYDTAQSYSINPQVLIVLLQKEQGLVTDTWPLNSQYRSATGYGCPDTAPCDAQYYGLANQIDWAAKMFRAILNASPTWYTPYVLGNNFIRYSPNASCGGSTVNIQNRATQALYNYTPYQPNAASLAAGYGDAAGDCDSHGNRNFYLYFTDWFGSVRVPTVFSTPSDVNIYVQASGYKFYVPTTELLSDWGLSTGAQSVSQTVADSIPLGGSEAGLSNTIGNIVKSPSDSDADGGNIYLISAGRRYTIRTIQQLQDFGFSSGDIHYLPLDFINTVADGGIMNNYVQATDSYSYLYSNGVKQLIPEGQAYANTHSLGMPSVINRNLLGLIPSITPLSDREVLFRTTNGAIYLYRNNSYFYVPSGDILSCWGFDTTLNTQKFWLAYDSAVGTITNTSNLDCNVSVLGNSYALNGSNKINIPSEYGFNTPALNTVLTDTVSRIPTRSKVLGRAVQSVSSPVVWYLEDGTKKGIPSLSDLQLLGYNGLNIDYVANGIISSLNEGGAKFGVGQVVRGLNNGATYVITSATTKRWITTPEVFAAYGYNWSSVNNYSNNAIDQYYTTEPQANLSNYLYTDTGGGIYLMDPYRCYGINTSQIAAFGIATTKSAHGQTYSHTIFPNVRLANCTNASIYLKDPSNSAVYLLENGQKRLVSTWQRLQQHSGTANPYIINVTQATLNTFQNGIIY